MSLSIQPLSPFRSAPPHTPSSTPQPTANNPNPHQQANPPRHVTSSGGRVFQTSAHSPATQPTPLLILGPGGFYNRTLGASPTQTDQLTDLNETPSPITPTTSTGGWARGDQKGNRWGNHRRKQDNQAREHPRNQSAIPGPHSRSIVTSRPTKGLWHSIARFFSDPAGPLPPLKRNRRNVYIPYGLSENKPPHKVTFAGESCFRGGCAACEYWGGGECGLKFVGPQPRLAQRRSRLFIGCARRGVGALHRSHNPRSISDAPPVQVGHLRLRRHLTGLSQLPPRHRRHRFNIHFSDLAFQQTFILSQQAFISPFFDTVAPSPGPGVRLVIGLTKTNVSSSARRNDRRRVHRKPRTNIRRIHA